MSWHTVDPSGLDVATGRRPLPPGAPSPAAALAAAPVVAWPVSVVATDGRRASLAQALGAGGDAVVALLSRLVAAGPQAPELDLPRLAAATPAGRVDLPLAAVALSEAAEAAAEVDACWLTAVEERRSAPRPWLAGAGRTSELEAALHVAMLVATERLGPNADDDIDARVASGAQLWLLAGAVAWALAGTRPDPFAPWAELVTSGLWPVGPSHGRLVVAVGLGQAPGGGEAE